MELAAEKLHGNIGQVIKKGLRHQQQQQSSASLYILY
jgi:hypothetical protein